MVDVRASDTAGGQSGEEPSSRSRPGDLNGTGFLGRIYHLLRDRGLAPAGLIRDAHSESVAEVLREHGQSDDPLGEEERAMLLNLLRFRTRRVDDVMVPRADIIAVEAETPLPELIDLFNEAGHSRLPVYRGTLDDPIGMVHIKDVVACLRASDAPESGKEDEGAANGREMTVQLDAPSSLIRLKRDVLFVPPSMPAADLLVQMQAQRMHMALVIDEYGGTDGLVTIEDLVEIIVGDIEDEHDVDSDPECTALEGGSFLADARVEIEDFEATSGLDLRLEGGEEEEVDTLGGLVFTLAGRVPRRGEIIRHPGGYDLEIVEADPRRIRRLKVSPSSKGETVSGAAAPSA